MRNIFIVGVGRSGTSLLQSILNANDSITFVPENGFLRKHVFRKINIKDIRKSARKRANSQVIETLGHTDTLNPLSLFKEYLLNYGSQYNARFIGDKDPRNLDYIQHLNHFFDSPVIIHIIRDPRDVIVSRLKANWSKKWPILLHALLYEVQMELSERNAKALNGGMYVELKYEDLLSKPQKIIESLLCELDLEYNESMMSFYQQSDVFIRKDELQWKSKLLQPLDINNKNKWARELKKYQIFFIEIICYKSMVKNGYKLSYKKSILREVFNIPVRLFLSFLSVFYYRLRQYR